MTATANKKQQIRKEILGQRHQLPAAFRHEADMAICENLRSLPELKDSKWVGAYVSDGTEPDLQMFIENFISTGGYIFLPRSCNGPAGLTYEMAEIASLETDLTRGAFDILEPNEERRAASDDEIKTMSWMVPGVAFDLKGRRLGRGKGFYDRLLSRGNGIKIGIFYECQKIEAVPVEAHDHQLDLVVTEATVYRLKR